MEIKLAKRMDGLAPYPFAEINRMRDEMSAKGIDVIDLGIGDPDLPTPDLIVNRMREEVTKKENHTYPPYLGLPDFRKEVAVFFKDRFGVDLDPSKEIIALIGSKEGLFHLPYLLLNEGDYSLVPDPGYPVYSVATKLIGGNVFTMPLLKENSFLPDLSKIPEDIANKAKIIFINYPNNPTSAGATKEFFAELAKFAEKYNIAVCHDAAYSEMYFGKNKPLSFLNVDKTKELSIEFHSLSKTFNMTGWRVGFAVGSAKLIGAFGRLKTNIDSGIFKAIQRAAIEGLKNWKKLTDQNRAVFQKRVERFSGMLRELGYKFIDPVGTFYLWVEVPGGLKSAEFAKMVLEKIGIVVTPGLGMGKNGDGYFRISLTAPDARLNEAIKRFEKLDPKDIG